MIGMTIPENIIKGLVQDCGSSSASAMELLQPCTKPSKYALILPHTEVGIIIIIAL